VLHEPIAMLKQVPDLLFDPLAVSRCLAGGGRRWTPAAKCGFPGGQVLADLGARVQHRLRQFLEDVKFAELMGDIAKPSSTTRRTAIAMTRSVEWLLDGAKSDRSTLK
jgi:hypothetical protein